MDENQLRKKHDKELIELLNELRVALPGVQVLFAFLLVAPFSARFGEITDTQEVVYTVSLLTTLVGTVLLMAPSAYHRLRWRERNKERMLRRSNELAIAGLVAVALAMTASILLITDVLFSSAVAIVVTIVTATMFILGWFVLPLSQPYDRWDDELDIDPDEDGGS